MLLIIQNASAFSNPTSDPLLTAKASIDFKDLGWGKGFNSLAYAFKAKIFFFQTSLMST